MSHLVLGRQTRRLTVFAFLLLFIEFIDEFLFGIIQTAWPLIRDDFSLSYVQIGLLLSVPGLIASFIEPVLGILADTWRRKLIILGGGVLFALSILMITLSQDANVLLLSFIVLFPSSGAFVSLSQSTLMDYEPSRHQQNMARWTLAGSLGIVCGVAAVNVIAPTVVGWRGLLVIVAVLSGAAVIMGLSFNFPRGNGDEDDEEEELTFVEGIRNALGALRRFEVIRWLVLLQFSDLMLDVLYVYIGLYFVDVVGTDERQAAFAIAIWTGVGLLGDFLIIPLLERVDGIRYLRFSTMVEFVLFTSFLLVPSFTVKLVLLAFIGMFNAGWYSILSGALYTDMPGQSGAVMAINNVGGLLGQLLPLFIGLLASWLGLNAAMWFILLGPLVLFFGLPRR